MFYMQPSLHVRTMVYLCYCNECGSLSKPAAILPSCEVNSQLREGNIDGLVSHAARKFNSTSVLATLQPEPPTIIFPLFHSSPPLVTEHCVSTAASV